MAPAQIALSKRDAINLNHECRLIVSSLTLLSVELSINGYS